MPGETKLLALTRQEAELILESVAVSYPLTRALALKAAGVVREWATEDKIAWGEVLLATAGTPTPPVP